MPLSAGALAASLRRTLVALAVVAIAHGALDGGWIAVVSLGTRVGQWTYVATNALAFAASFAGAFSAVALGREVMGRARLLARVAAVAFAAEAICEVIVGGAALRRSDGSLVLDVALAAEVLYGLAVGAMILALVCGQPWTVWSRATARLATALTLSAATIASGVFGALASSVPTNLRLSVYGMPFALLWNATELVLSALLASAVMAVAQGLGHERPPSREAPLPALERVTLARCGHLGLIALLQFAFVIQRIDAHDRWSRPLNASVMFVVGQLPVAWVLARCAEIGALSRIVAAGSALIGIAMLVAMVFGLWQPELAWSGHLAMLPLLVAPLLGREYRRDDGSMHSGRKLAMVAIAVGFATLLFDDLLLPPDGTGALTSLGLATAIAVGTVLALVSAVLSHRIAREGAELGRPGR